MRNAAGIGTLARACIGACLLALVGAATGAAAQNPTGSIRGTVSGAEGAAVPAAAVVVARNTQTGFVQRAPVQTGGFYNLAGLAPGTYQVTVDAAGAASAGRTVQVLVGQALTLDLRVGTPTVALAGITAVGQRVEETQTSEVATNVTRQQIEALPQGDRNFLNFAQLANGVQLSLDDQRKTFRSGGQPAENVNVFIDGVSYKNDILQGGVAGQDASRGNPFPQNAIAEFRVITENYKAEYQKASGGIITAVTRTGGNRWEGSGFAYGQPNSFVEQDFFANLHAAWEQAWPRPRVVVQFHVTGRAAPNRFWLVLSTDGNEVCAQAPGFREDGLVTTDTASLVRWYAGEITLGAAQRAGALTVVAPRWLVTQLAARGRLSPYAGVARHRPLLDRAYQLARGRVNDSE